MASGDPFLLVTLSGNGALWSYTTAAGVNLVVTGLGGYSVGLQIGAQGSPFVTSYFQVSADRSEDSYPLKQMLTAGTLISANSTHIDTYGVALCGIEL